MEKKIAFGKVRALKLHIFCLKKPEIFSFGAPNTKSTKICMSHSQVRESFSKLSNCFFKSAEIWDKLLFLNSNLKMNSFEKSFILVLITYNFVTHVNGDIYLAKNCEVSFNSSVSEICKKTYSTRGDSKCFFPKSEKFSGCRGKIYLRKLDLILTTET